jgi:LacI family transcriptional regulator
MRHVALLMDFDSPWERSYLEGVERYLHQARGAWSIYTEQGRLGLPMIGLRRWQGDGIIGFFRDPQLIRFIQRSGVPAVNSSWEGLLRGLTSVVPDRHRHGMMAAEYFLRRGFCQYVYVRHRRTRAPYEQGFAERLVQEGLRYHVLYCPTTLPRGKSWDRALSVLTDGLKRIPKPAAVVCLSDVQAARIVATCADCSIAVPRDLAVLGRGNDMICKYTEPPLSSLAQNYAMVGVEAAALLDRLMAGSPLPSEPIFVAETEVVERQSTNLLPVGDPLLRQVLDYIAEHACDPLTVKDLVRRFALNRRTLQRLFLRHLRRQPNSEIIRVRIGRAQRLLEETDLPLSKVAKACGFSGAVSLGIAFRRETGLTPGKYRKRLKPQEPLHVLP